MSSRLNQIFEIQFEFKNFCFLSLLKKTEYAGVTTYQQPRFHKTVTRVFEISMLSQKASSSLMLLQPCFFFNIFFFYEIYSEPTSNSAEQKYFPEGLGIEKMLPCSVVNLKYRTTDIQKFTTNCFHKNLRCFYF